VSKLLLAFYGDDFTGSTDALEQLTLAGIRTMLFIEAPSVAQLKRFPGTQAVGIAGTARSLAPEDMRVELEPAFKKLKALGVRHVHYKVCSTFDSSPRIGNIGCVLDVAEKIFRGPFVPLLVAAPTLGRFTIFGTHFARYGIGSGGKIFRLDRHPSISRHPITPMLEADLRLHLAKQTKKRIALFDILQVALPEHAARAELKRILSEKPQVVLFDAIYPEHLARIGSLIDGFASAQKPLFSIGSSGIETALTGSWSERKPRHRVEKRLARTLAPPVKQLLVGSGSCSPVTEKQIAWAVKNGFAEVFLNARKFRSPKSYGREINRANDEATKLLQAGRSVIIHTTRGGPDKRVTTKLKNRTARVLGVALGAVLWGVLVETKVHRVCIAGGDTSSFAARALGIEALEMIAPLTAGAPLCRVIAPNSPADSLEIVFKGGQVGAENYFGVVKRGKNFS
jgi:3-oxoisoapionate kinase